MQTTPPPPPTTACTWDPLTAGSWSVNRKQSGTQLFYLVNRFQDYLRDDRNFGFADHSFERRPGKGLGDPNGAADASASDPVLAVALPS